MGLVMGVTAAILAIAAGLVGLMVWTALLFPGPTTRAGSTLEARPVRCFGIGVVITLLLGAPALALLNAPNGLAKLAGWALLFPLVVLLAVGLSAMARLLGERLRLLSPALTPLGGLVRGAITLELPMILPFVGWFVLAPLIAITVIGAGTTGCFRRKSTGRHGEPPTNKPSAGLIMSTEFEPAPAEPMIPPLPSVPCLRSAMRNTPSEGTHANPA